MNAPIAQLSGVVLIELDTLKQIRIKSLIWRGMSGNYPIWNVHSEKR